MPKRLTRYEKLADPGTMVELSALRDLMADCLGRMDRLGLTDVAQHLDLALVRFDEAYPVGAFVRVALEREDDAAKETG